MSRTGLRPVERGSRISGRSLLPVAAILCAATLALVWFGWTATRELRQAAAQRVRRRTEATLVLLGIAIDRDMQGAWISVLVPIEPFDIEDDPPYDFLQVSARAFARFSYLESFIVWKSAGTLGGQTYAFNRADRVIPWAPVQTTTVAYPVVLQRAPSAMQPVVDLIRGRANLGRRFVLIETTIAGVPYQVVAHLMFDRADAHQLVGFVAFLVNLQWVRQYYFAELLPQITALAGGQAEVSLSISDASGQLIATSGNKPAVEAAATRAFPLLFFDERLARPNAASTVRIQEWTAGVRPASAVTLAAQAAGKQTFLLISCAAVAALVSLLLVLRTTRAQAELASLRSDFVATVTHELKTPLALIKLVAETLEKGRYTSAEVVREYATLLSQETARLGQLIDNLLTLSQVSNLRQPYTFENLDPADLVDETLQQFWPRLNQLGFNVHVGLAPGLSQIRADRTAMRQVLGNLVDNAIKYSGSGRKLCVEGGMRAGAVVIAVADSGTGIGEQDVDRVFDKFFRGRGTAASGSGLGLTIARRVIEAHGGTIRVESLPGQGTRVEVTLPSAEV